MRKRPIAVLFRLNEQEHQHMTEQSEIAGFSTAQYLRNLIAGTDMKPKPPGEMAEILRQLSAIGNNINQIAKIANTYDRIRQEDVEYIINMQTKIWRMVKRL